jgi:hypothetical protein
MFTQAQLESPPLGHGPYPKKWLANLLFMKRVMKELTNGHFWALRVIGATSRGVWCEGSYQAWLDRSKNKCVHLDFQIFYRHQQKPGGLTMLDCNWRLMWSNPQSRKWANKYDLIPVVDDAIFAAMRKVRELEAREKANV